MTRSHLKGFLKSFVLQNLERANDLGTWGFSETLNGSSRFFLQTRELQTQSTAQLNS